MRTAYFMRLENVDSFLFPTTSSSPQSFPVSTVGVFSSAITDFLKFFLSFEGLQAMSLLLLSTYISLKGILDCLKLELSE